VVTSRQARRTTDPVQDSMDNILAVRREFPVSPGPLEPPELQRATDNGPSEITIR
jgi:hypothetical protein